jgi:hypothetical protein
VNGELVQLKVFTTEITEITEKNKIVFYSALSVNSVVKKIPDFSGPLRSLGHCRAKFTVTVMMTGTGTPFRYVGVNSH